jgi:hypothetical protein
MTGILSPLFAGGCWCISGSMPCGGLSTPSFSLSFLLSGTSSDFLSVLSPGFWAGAVSGACVAACAFTGAENATRTLLTQKAQDTDHGAFSFLMTAVQAQRRVPRLEVPFIASQPAFEREF